MRTRASTLFVVAVVAAQVAVLAWMAGEREWILRTGKPVMLRTAPIDPRDLFRGDYVRLDYEINHVPTAAISGVAEVKPGERPRHEVVYTRLSPFGEGLFEAAGASTTRPADGLFIRGRIEDSWRFAWRGGAGATFVKYGIEQFFVEQGLGKVIEDKRGARDGLQVPMEVEVALSPSGTGVIRGYRWSRLGMKLEVTRRPAPRRPNTANAAPPPPPTDDGPLSPKLKVTLANASDAPIAVVDNADHCTFRLVPVDVGGQALEMVPPAQCATAKPVATDVITLAPGQVHAVEVDLSEPRWFVTKDGKPVELGSQQGFAQYRIEYRAPAAAELPDGGAIWRGRMASQAFNATGAID